MKKLFACLFTLMMSVGAGFAPVWAASAHRLSEMNHPADDGEAKLDQFMTDFMKRYKAIKAEKDDKKAIVLIKQAKDEFMQRALKLKPELEAWAKRMEAMDEQAREKKLAEKPWLKEMIQEAFDMSFQDRLNRNPELKAAMDELNTIGKILEGKDWKADLNNDVACTFTLNGGPFKNETFVVKSNFNERATAIYEDGTMMFEIDGMSGSRKVGLSFYVEGEKPVNYKWVGDYSISISIADAGGEKMVAGHENGGSIAVESVGKVGDMIKGRFDGTTYMEGYETPIKLNGTFQVKRKAAL